MSLRRVADRQHAALEPLLFLTDSHAAHRAATAAILRPILLPIFETSRCQTRSQPTGLPAIFQKPVCLS